MGLLSDLQNLINEHGSSSILRERLLLFKDKIAKLETENRDLKEAIAGLQIENTKLHKQLKDQATTENFIEHRGALFKRKPSGGYNQTVYCPKCKVPLSSLEKIIPYHCQRCSITLDFTGKQLPQILSELEQENP